MRLKLTALTVAVLLLSASPASAKPWKQIGEATGSGDYAFALVDGSVRRPKAVKIELSAAPAQAVSSFYSISCSKRFDFEASSGSYDGIAPATINVALPIRRADRCSLSADIFLKEQGPGTVIVTLFAKQR
jgi:hypothetical protein